MHHFGVEMCPRFCNVQPLCSVHRVKSDDSVRVYVVFQQDCSIDTASSDHHHHWAHEPTSAAAALSATRRKTAGGSS